MGQPELPHFAIMKSKQSRGSGCPILVPYGSNPVADAKLFAPAYGLACAWKKFQMMSFVVTPVVESNLGLKGIWFGTFIGELYQLCCPPARRNNFTSVLPRQDVASFSTTALILPCASQRGVAVSKLEQLLAAAAVQ